MEEADELKNVIITCDGKGCNKVIEIKVVYTDVAVSYYPKPGEKYYCTTCKRNNTIF